MTRPWSFVLPALAALLAGCDDATPGAAPRPSPACQPDAGLAPGLRTLARVTAPNGGTGQTAGHLSDLAIMGDDLYLANAQDAVATFRLQDGTGVASTAPLAEGVDPHRPSLHTAVALHERSGTLYGAYALGDYVASYRLTPGRAPRLLAERALDDPRLGARDLAVSGDVLYLALFHHGLFAASIGADGAPSDLRDTGLGGDVRAVEVSGDRAVVLDAERGMVVARVEGRAVTETARLALDGPRLDLSVRGDVAYAALGSEGAAVVDLAGGRPTLRAMLRPPGVVTSVDGDGSLAAVACTSGVFLYDLSGASPRLAGYDPSHAITLRVRFHRGELLAADWLDVVRYRVDGHGRVSALDVAWGAYDRPGARSLVVARNVGGDPLGLVVMHRGGDLARATVAGGETFHAEVPDAAFEVRGEYREFSPVVQARDAQGCALDGFSPRVVQRVAPPGGRSPPAVGDPMPSLTLARPGGGTVTVPEAGHVSRVVFWSADCAAMWPEVEDLDWLAGAGRPVDGAEAVLVSSDDPARTRVTDRWPLRNVRLAFWGSPFDNVPPEVQATASRYGGDVYEGGFVNPEMLSGAQHPTDYLVERDGVVRAVERLYRGAFPLR